MTQENTDTKAAEQISLPPQEVLETVSAIDRLASIHVN